MLLLLTIVVFVGGIIAFATYRAEPGRRRELLSEAALLGTGFFVYFLVRKVTEGGAEQAEANAELIISVQESLGIFIEPALNQAAVDRDWLMNAANWVYIWGHWPLIALVAAWLYRAQPHGYRLTRNAFLFSGAIGFLFFALFPVAPPRLMGPEFVDTITEFSHSYRVLQPPEVTNQYAAFPSLHFGWNLLIGIAVATYARPPWLRVLGAISPLAMLAATVFTANHYLLDLAMGAVVALTGLLIASFVVRARGPREATAILDPPPPPPQSAPDHG